MAQAKIHVGLEIGTTKTCMVVAEVYPNAKATIIGIGVVPSVKVAKGEITDQVNVRQCVTDAWQLAQDNANVDICSVILAITGEHIKGDNHQAFYRLPDGDFVVAEKHLRELKAQLADRELPPDRIALDEEMGPYLIDDREASYHPIGLTGQTIRCNVHEMNGIQTRLQNSLHCVRQVPLEVDSMVFSAYATAQVILGRKQKDAGALVIDIGGGTTDYICYLKGEIVASGCIPVGGNNINHDIVQITKSRIDKAGAEYLKCTYGNVMGDVNDQSEVEYTSDNGLKQARIKRGELNRIIFDRLYETMKLVKSRIPEQALANKNMSIYLAGGTSVLPGLDEMVCRMFSRPVYQPELPDPKDKTSFLNDPRYCTAIGLIRYAQLFEEDKALHSASSWWKKLVGLFKSKKF